MAKARKPNISSSSILVSSAELAKTIGTDLETVKNWIRRGIISRASLGGRQLRNRLFSNEEVYRTAFINELVTLGFLPSAASEAVNDVWKEWGKKDAPEGWNTYAVVFPSKDKWTVLLCLQKPTGGLLYKFGKSIGAKSIEEMDLPKQAVALIPISAIFDRINCKLSQMLAR
jgi:hypothetical protein